MAIGLEQEAPLGCPAVFPCHAPFQATTRASFSAQCGWRQRRAEHAGLSRRGAPRAARTSSPCPSHQAQESSRHGLTWGKDPLNSAWTSSRRSAGKAPGAPQLAGSVPLKAPSCRRSTDSCGSAPATASGSDPDRPPQWMRSLMGSAGRREGWWRAWNAYYEVQAGKRGVLVAVDARPVARCRQASRWGGGSVAGAAASRGGFEGALAVVQLRAASSVEASRPAHPLPASSAPALPHHLCPPPLTLEALGRPLPETTQAGGWQARGGRQRRGERPAA